MAADIGKRDLLSGMRQFLEESVEMKKMLERQSLVDLSTATSEGSSMHSCSYLDRETSLAALFGVSRVERFRGG